MNNNPEHLYCGGNKRLLMVAEWQVWTTTHSIVTVVAMKRQRLLMVAE
jgi:hypothetical protein